MNEKKFDPIDLSVIDLELKIALHASKYFGYFLIFITLGTFIIPIGFLSRTARRMGEYSTLYQLHGKFAVYVTIAIYVLVILSFLGYYKVIQLLLDRKNKIKTIKTVKVLNVIELSEKQKNQWKILNKNYTHQLYVNYQDKFYFDGNTNPNLLNAKMKEIELAKNSEVILKERYY